MPHRVTATACLVLALTLAACSSRTQAPAPAPAPVTTAPVTTAPPPAAKPAEAPPHVSTPASPITLENEPVVDWPTGGTGLKLPGIQVHAGVCQPGTAPGGTHLQVRLASADWRVHPVSNGEFWSPTAVLTVCNAGRTALEHPYLQVAAGSGDKSDTSSQVSLPKLQPGEGLGPIRVYAASGVSARLGHLWMEDGRLWPDWSVRVTEEKVAVAEGPVRRMLGGTGTAAPEAAGGTAAMPDPPPLPLLQRLAWSQGTFSPNGKQQVSIYLYAPDAVYDMQEDSYCGAHAGQVGVQGTRWAFYTSTDGSPPVRAKEIGNLGFQGGRGMSVETVPALNLTFLMLGWYGTCANPNLYHMYAYDHAAHEFFQPRMQYADGKVDAPSVGSYSFTPDGKLVSKGYTNAGPDAGWHTNIYRWEQKQRMWLFESHVRSN
jgi:hypothetical protein